MIIIMILRMILMLQIITLVAPHCEDLELPSRLLGKGTFKGTGLARIKYYDIE